MKHWENDFKSLKMELENLGYVDRNESVNSKSRYGEDITDFYFDKGDKVASIAVYGEHAEDLEIEDHFMGFSKIVLMKIDFL